MSGNERPGIRCGWCGDQLERIGEDHNCPEGLRAAAFMATGDPEVFSDDIKQDGDADE